MKRHRSVPYVRNALFRGIPKELLARERIVSEPLSLSVDTVVFEEGDAPDYCYLVGSGAVRISKALPDGQDELLAMIQPGDFFGELALYDAAPRSARATAAVPTRVARIGLEAFDYLRRVAPLQIASTLADRTIERVRRTNIQLVTELAAAGRLSSLGSELGMLSHNLRSPLATIRNAADILYEMLEDEASRAETARFVAMIGETADKALTQVDHLMARLRGEDAAHWVRITPAALLQDLRRLTAGYFTDAAIRYRDENVSFAGEVSVDRSEFVAALANLVKNAVEALPVQGGEIEMSVSGEGDAVVFAVSDTGVGIAPEHLPMLFERRFTHGKPGGTGLGLSHVRSVAERHGGRVFVDSRVGRGTTVRLSVPRIR